MREHAQTPNLLKQLGNARSRGDRRQSLGATAVMVGVRYAPGADFGGEHGEPRAVRKKDTFRTLSYLRGRRGGFALKYVIIKRKAKYT